jgi:hypothetical protein
VGALVTSWDTTDYARTAGVFCEGFFDPGFTPQDWAVAVNYTLSLVNQNKIVMLEHGLDTAQNVALRRYLFANYLLVKGRRTYLFYGTRLFSWFPEWDLDLGAALTAARSVDELRWQGVYRREFAKGVVLVNPSDGRVRVQLGAVLKRVSMDGGGPVTAAGTATGHVVTSPVTELDLPAKSAEILLR